MISESTGDVQESKKAMAMLPSDSRSVRSEILDHLRTLRIDFRQARDALLHFKTDRSDRDKLEPAARRIDQLMEIFSNNEDGPDQGAAWVSEIQHAVDQMTNPKSAYALRDTVGHLASLRDAMRLHADAKRQEIN